MKDHYRYYYYYIIILHINNCPEMEIPEGSKYVISKALFPKLTKSKTKEAQPCDFFYNPFSF